MIEPGYLPIKADRFTSFVMTFIFGNVDMRGRTMKIQVRPSKNDTGTALVTLNNTTTPGAEGLRITKVEEDGSGNKTSFVEMRISEATIAAMPAAAGLTGDQLTDDEDLFFAWDFVETRVNGDKDVILYGPFVLRAGVTQ